MKSCMMGFATGALLGASIAALAVDGSSTGTRTHTLTMGTAATTTPVTNAGTTRVEDRIAYEFTVFAGSQDNAHSLVTGLRKGDEITLVSPATSGRTGTISTFTPPTRPMGYGNVRISLALAQEQLIRLGITHPTADQLRAALVGGTFTSGSGATATTTELQGVLQMRAQGMGWGRIANAMGTKLGHVMSGLRQTNPPIANGQPMPGAGAAGSAGVTTAAGTGSGAASGRGQGRGNEIRGEAGAGIVTAAGGPAATGAQYQGGGNGHGAGMVTGAGTMVGSHVSAAGMANGHGHAKP